MHLNHLAAHWGWAPQLYRGFHRTGTGVCLQKELAGPWQRSRKKRQNLNISRAIVLSLAAHSHNHLPTLKNVLSPHLRQFWYVARPENHDLESQVNSEISHFLLTNVEASRTMGKSVDHGFMWAHTWILQNLLLVSLHKTLKLLKQEFGFGFIWLVV